MRIICTIKNKGFEIKSKSLDNDVYTYDENFEDFTKNLFDNGIRYSYTEYIFGRLSIVRTVTFYDETDYNFVKLITSNFIISEEYRDD